MNEKNSNSSNDAILTNLLFLLRKNGKNGVSRKALNELYFNAKGAFPTDRAITRLFKHLNLLLCRQAVMLYQEGTHNSACYFLEKMSF